MSKQQQILNPPLAIVNEAHHILVVLPSVIDMYRRHENLMGIVRDARESRRLAEAAPDDERLKRRAEIDAELARQVAPRRANLAAILNDVIEDVRPRFLQLCEDIRVVALVPELGLPGAWEWFGSSAPSDEVRVLLERLHAEAAVAAVAVIEQQPLAEAAVSARDAPRAGEHSSADDDPVDAEQQPPALTKSDRMTLTALATFDRSRLASALEVSDAVPRCDRLSERTTRQGISNLIKLDLAERPEGEKQGARLTTRGRRLASQIDD